jgi:hypothetical protein
MSRSKRRLAAALERREAAAPEAGLSSPFLGRYLDTPPTPFGRRLRSAVKVIEAVHEVRDLQRIPVEESNSRDFSGEFHRHRGTGRPVKILVSNRGNHPELSFVHEVGHFLEQTAIPGHRWGERDWGFDRHIGGFVEAVMRTRAVSALRTRHDAQQDVGSKRYLAYLLSQKELWARSYAQYVATRSGYPVLLAQLENQRSPASPSPIEFQWQDNDFDPVARAIDALFRSIGWNP